MDEDVISSVSLCFDVPPAGHVYANETARRDRRPPVDGGGGGGDGGGGGGGSDVGVQRRGVAGSTAGRARIPDGRHVGRFHDEPVHRTAAAGPHAGLDPVFSLRLFFKSASIIVSSMEWFLVCLFFFK